VVVAGAFPFAIHNSIVEGWVGLFGVCMLLMGIGLCGFWVDTVLRLQKADPFGDDSKKSNCKWKNKKQLQKRNTGILRCAQNDGQQQRQQQRLRQ
jgi:hypothetical protein